MGKIDKATVDKIYDAINIVDVVGEFVSLKKRGSSYLGLCPFHNERTPSFSVSPSRGIFKCFSCGKAGNAVSFLTDLEGMSYVEALKWLAKKYNIEVKEREVTTAEAEADARREALFAANDFAISHFEKNLKETDEGRQIGLSYFRERGINDAMIARFHLGYALEKFNDLYYKAHSAGFEDEYLTETGLVVKTENGRLYDRFKGRVIFPVHSQSGRVVAFGGRTLRKEKTVAKYVNSPESAIYSKSHELYGLFQARNAIAKKQECILVEGYLDVISMHQAGIENVVASSGTSLTEGQINKIKRLARNVTLIYDSDAAGIKASLRGINMLLAAGLALKVVLLPEGDDPDSFAQRHTSSEVEEYLAAHCQDLIGFKADVLLTDAGADPRRRTEAINDILQSVALIPDLVEQSLYLDECARKVGIDQSILAAQLKRIMTSNALEREKKQQRAEAAASTATPEAVVVDAAQAPAVEPYKAPADVPLKILLIETDLMRYILRYGFFYMCQAFVHSDDPEPRSLSVVDYIQAEFNVEGTDFRHPAFRDIWHRALALRDSKWPSALHDREAIEQQHRNEALTAAIDQIRQSNVDMNSLLELEQKATERIDAQYNEEIDKFSSAFLRDELLKSENRAMTDLVAQLTAEPIVLSRMYPKIDDRKEVVEKLPVAINTLKSQILKQNIEDLTAKLIDVQDKERAGQILLEIHGLKMRSMDLDKFTGEIVIIP